MPGNYSWKFKGSPNLYASYVQLEDLNGENIYRDLASLNHYFELTGDDIIDNGTQMLRFIYNDITPAEAADMFGSIWNLRILEDELTGECGSGAINCFDSIMTVRRKKRSVHSAWQSYGYTKV